MAHIGAATYAGYLGGNPIAARHQQRIAIAKSTDYTQFAHLLTQDITDIANLMQANPQRRSKQGEDGLTDEIVLALNVAGYDASHDRSSGGHVDVTVKLGCHSWIGEAKKDSKYDEGYKQLVSRYRPASGNFKHNHAGMLLYYTGKSDLIAHRDAWYRKFVSTFQHKYRGLQFVYCGFSDYAFFSKHRHPVSGKEFIVRHLVIGLQFHPEDASARASKSRKKRRGVKNPNS
jgi:hypothetical protein